MKRQQKECHQTEGWWGEAGGGAQQQTTGTADIIRLWLIGDFTSPIVETDGDTISQQ